MRCIQMLGAVAFPSLLATSPLAAQATAVTAFVGIAVIPMDRERVLTHQTVLVRGDRIMAMGPAMQVTVPTEAARIDGAGKFLLPGLGDMHVHVLQRGDSIPLPDKLLVFVANGVTTIRDLGPAGMEPNPEALQLRGQVARGTVVGPRLYVAREIDPTTPSVAMPAAVAAIRQAGYDAIGEFGGGGDRAFVDSLIAAARRAGLRVVGHAPDGSAVNFQDVLDRYQDTYTVEHLYGYYAYLTGDFKHLLNPMQVVADTALQRVARETAQAGVWNCPTLYIHDDILHRSKNPQLRAAAFYPRLAKALQDAGAGLLLGSDVGTNNSGLAKGFLTESDAPRRLTTHYIVHELEAFVRAGLTPYEALMTGTGNIARYLGTADSTGTVAVGKRADLVVLTGNPLTDIRHVTHLVGVMLGGRWLPREDLDARIAALVGKP